MDERRRAARISVSFSVQWQGSWARRDGVLADLSIGGCFILTDTLIKVRETVRVEIQIPKGQLQFTGEVLYIAEERGFALRFTDASADDLKRLQWLIKAEEYRAERGTTADLK